MKITAINKYPVKSLKGASLRSAVIDDFGIKHDRRWMLVDADGRFVTQRKHPVMGTIAVEECDESLVFTTVNGQVLTVSTEDFTQSQKTCVWGDDVNALVAGPVASAWFSELLGMQVNLAYMPESSFRQVDREFADYSQRVSYVDGFPFLLTTEASLQDLNEKLDTKVSMTRFRPNLVVSGAQAFEEDKWKRIRVGEVEFDVVKPCSRCIMTTIDEQSLKYGKEPLKTLSSYRRNEYGVCFGQNLVHRGQGSIELGDEVEVLEWI